MSLHEGNFARYQIRPSESEAWQRPGNRVKQWIRSVGAVMSGAQAIFWQLHARALVGVGIAASLRSSQ